MLDIKEISSSILSGKRSNHHRDKFFPLLIEKIGAESGVEIGVDKADFSEKILSNTSIKKYYCVDTWQDDFGSDYRPEYFSKDGSERYNAAFLKIKKHIEADRAIMLRMDSVNASSRFDNESIDFCYIDGDHTLGGVYDDLKYWMPKIKIGGICSGHDYKDGPKSGINDYYGKQIDFKVKTVVDYYCQRYGYSLNVVGGRILSWWFLKNH